MPRPTPGARAPRRRRRAASSAAAAPSRGARRAPAAHAPAHRKERRAALRSALSIHAERESLAIFDAGKGFDTPSTQAAAKLLGDWLGKSRGSVLVVLDDAEQQVALSFRNLKRVAVLPVEEAGVYDIVWAASLVLSQPALDTLTARAGGAKEEAA